MLQRFVLWRCCPWLVALLALCAITVPSTASISSLSVSATWRPESSGLSNPAQKEDGETRVPPAVEIVFPKPHSWWQVSEDTGRLNGLTVLFTLRNFRIPEDGFLRMTGEKIQQRGSGAPGAFTIHDNTSSFTVSDIEPGSFFFLLELVNRPLDVGDHGDSGLMGTEHAVAQTTLHLEVVAPLSSSPMLTYTPVDPYAAPPLRQVKLDARATSARSHRPPTPICYIIGAGSNFDGQKKMWLQLIKALSPSQPKANLTTRNSSTLEYYEQWAPSFRVEVLTFDKIVPDSPMVLALEKLGIPLKGGIQEIAIEKLSQANVSVEELESTVIERFYAEFPEASPLTHGSAIHRRLSTRDQGRLANLQPEFVQDAWRVMVKAIHESCADGIVVMSNSRFVTDKLIVNAARLAGARAVVMELANLFPEVMEVDALFAPSRFALRHPSVVSSLLVDRSFAVSTGVNTEVFSPGTGGARNDKEDGNNRTFVVGFVGRLSTDKSVGVLIATAKVLRLTCAFCKLRLIGDGVLKPHLEALAAEWGLLGSAVEFIDGIFNDEAKLAAELRKMHVYATPALETLGISVLEAMSTGLPVVGFILGGTTEFLSDGFNCVGVQERSAEAFSDAIMTLVRDPRLREEMGRNARTTIEQRFSRNERIKEIAMLYQSLVQH